MCETVIAPSATIPALGHNPGDWIIDKVAGEASDGMRHRECLRCAEVSSREIIPATGAGHTHSGAYWSQTTPATCKAEGVKSFICSCGYAVETEVVAKVDHVTEVILGKSATCKETGLTTGKKCTVCGEVTFAQSVIAIADHVTEVILGKSATCTESGISDGLKCSFCGTTVTAQRVTPPKGHSFEKAVCKDCGQIEPYGIWIVDGLGNPISDVIVKLMKDGEMIKMYPYSGEFVSFDVEIGTYQLELDLSQLNQSYVYDITECTLTPDNRSAYVRLFLKTEETETIYVGYPIELDYTAYHVSEGSYQVDLAKNDYTFFIFTPKTAATYAFTYECESELSVGYHGGTFFVQGQDISSGTKDFGKYGNGLYGDIYQSNIGGSIVISIKSTDASSCIFNVYNIGETGTRLEDQPWTPYLEDAEKVDAQLALKGEGEYTPIDLTDLTISAVLNKKDGYYHLNSEDGPIIYIDLTSNSSYISSIQTICANQRMGEYVYDINGKVTEKRSYNELFQQYGMPGDTSTVDEPIRVPLTEKLASAIISFGDKNSWWKVGSESNIFTAVLNSTPYNQEYAWLLYCGIYK